MTVQPVTGETFLTIDNQRELFAGCSYELKSNKIRVEGIALALDRQRFNVQFGGYVFVLGNENGASTRSAWRAFMDNRRLLGW